MSDRTDREISVTWQDAREVGSCCNCSERKRRVYVIQVRTMELRLCHNCAAELGQKLPRWKRPETE